MATKADSLLNTLSADDISTYVANASLEEHIVIDAERFINVPDSLKRIAVQFDHHVETVTFDCPRYWDEHDFSKMVVYINYRTPDGELGTYIADNVRVSDSDDSIINFEWLITENVTYRQGKLAFLICIKDLENHWNSELCTSMYVSEGLELSEDTNLGNTDILTQLLVLYGATIELNKATMARPGVYFGTGEMPDWADVQIDPEGDDVQTLVEIRDGIAYIRHIDDNAIMTAVEEDGGSDNSTGDLSEVYKAIAKKQDKTLIVTGTWHEDESITTDYSAEEIAEYTATGADSKLNINGMSLSFMGIETQGNTGMVAHYYVDMIGDNEITRMQISVIGNSAAFIPIFYSPPDMGYATTNYVNNVVNSVVGDIDTLLASV